jgi:membrane associated rhomboid family serine protease
VLTKFGREFDSVSALWFSNHSNSGPMLARLLGVPEFHKGEFWRLLTPIFIHMGALHFFFNAMWMADLGSMIESRQSTWLMAGSFRYRDRFEYRAIRGHGPPHFGGLSGVVYGSDRLYVDPREVRSNVRLCVFIIKLVLMAMIWFFLLFHSLRRTHRQRRSYRRTWHRDGLGLDGRAATEANLPGRTRF